MIGATTALLLATALLALVLGGFVFSRSPGRIEHRAFLAVSVNIALWAVGVAFIVTSDAESQALRWVQATFVVGAFLPATFFFFLEHFPRPFDVQRLSAKRRAPRTPAWTWIAAGSILIAAGAFSPWYEVEVNIAAGLPPEVWQRGFVTLAYALFVLGSFVFALVRIVRKLREAAGIERRQVQYVLLGIFASSGLAIATNVLAPLLRIEATQQYGPTFFIIMVAFFGYAMVRYHLLDVWVIVGRTTLYAVLTAATALVFIGSVLVVQLLIPRLGEAVPGDSAWFDSGVLSSLLAAVLVMLVILPLRDWLQNRLNRVFIKRQYDSAQLMARISRQSAQVSDLDNLLHTTGSDLYQTVGAEPTRILLLEEGEQRATAPPVILYSSREGEVGTPSVPCPAVIAHLETQGEPIVLEEVLHDQRLGIDLGDRERTSAIADELASLEAHLCVALATSTELIGLIILGPKLSREVWSREDVLVFSTIAAPLATALANARLYDQLQKANLQRGRILAQMRSGVVAISADQRISLLNDTAEALFPEARVGSSVESLPAVVQEALHETLRARREISDYEVVFEISSGDEAHVAISTALLPALRPEGGPPGAMALLYDMTQMKRLERNVQRADRLTSIGMLAAGMAHEIKNPLVSIKTFAQLLNSRFEDPEFREAFVELVPHEVDRIDSIVSRLLDFARPNTPRQSGSEPKRGQSVHEPLDVPAVLRKVLALLENQIERTGISVETLWPDRALYIVGDAQQMHQVFLNLMLNAIDAMRESPERRLRLVVRREYLKPLHAGPAQPNTEHLAIVVEDTGCGIDEDHLDQLFTPFFTTKEHGSGLGLAVVHGIIAEHGGQVDAEIVPRGGARFTVLLPAALDLLEPGAPHVAPARVRAVEFTGILPRKE